MALIFSVTHTVTFGTHAGEDYQWELDLLRSYDDSEATPSWLGAATVQVTASNSPIEVEWMSDSDVYKPIMSSKAKVGLHKIIGDNLPRFTSAGQFEYQIRLRYRRNGESTLNDYWCGFIQSSDGSEDVSGVSPQITFNAIDNLGGMEDSTVNISSGSVTPINLLNQLLESVRQTGLDLPVMVESGIRNAAGDALTNVTAHPYSLFKSTEDKVEYRKKLTNKEMIGGLLSAFNCKIFQSYGKWFIVNASTHGGTGANETCTFSKYTVQNAVYVADGTENVDLIYNVGGNAPDVVVANSDLQLNTRRPYGSVECKPKNAKNRNFVTNGLLEDGTNGFGVETGVFQPLNRISISPQSDSSHPSTQYAFDTSVNRFRLDGLGLVWFKTDQIAVDVNAPLKFSFDYLLTKQSNSQTMNLNYCVVMRSSNVVNVSSSYTNNPNNYYSTSTQNTFTYNFDDERWVPGFHILSDYKVFASKTPYQGRSSTSELYAWNTAEHTMELAEYWDAANGQHQTLAGTIQIYWFYPQSKRSGRSRSEGSNINRVGCWATNFKIKNEYSNDITKPTYERVQSNYTKTETYSPMFADNLPVSVYNRLDQEGFWRENETVTESTTLERIVTQQKLNDNRDEFRFYEGTFINISSDPIAPHHKLKMDWNNYTEAETLIFKGGTYRPKEGEFDISHYAPNQSTDIAPGNGSVNDDGTVTPGFFEYDVDLVADNFTGRSKRVVYSLAVVPQGLTDAGGLFTTEPLTIDGLPSGVLQVSGYAGDISSHTVKISVADTFEASASNMSYFDGTNQGTGIWQLLEEGEDTANHVSNLQFIDLGRELEITFDVTLPSLSEFEQIRIAGEVDPFLASNREVDITFSLANSYGGSIVNPTRNLRGIPGTNAFINCIVTPDTGKEFNASAFSATVPSYMTVKSVEQLGTSAYIEFEVLFQETDQTASVVITGATSTDLPLDLELSTVTLNLSESISNVSLSRTQIVITGVVGTIAVYDVTVYAADGFELTSGNFSITESQSWLNMGNATGGGETVLIPLEITFPAANATGTATIGGSAQAIGSDTVSITLNFTNSITGTTLTDSSETFILNPGQRVSYTNTITPSRGTFINASGVTITESSAVVAFAATDAGGGSVNVSTSISAPSSSVTIPITLTGAVSAEPYLATLNVSETLPNGRLATNSLSQRFGATDTNALFSGVVITPIEDGTAYASGTTFTIVGGTASSYTYANGSVTFNLLVSLPAFSASNPIGDVSVPVSITSTIKPPGISGTFCTVSVPHAGIPATGGPINIFVDTDGAWETGGGGSFSGGGRYAPTSGTGPSVINVEGPYLANNFNSKSIGIVVRSLDGTNSNQVNLTQSDAFGQRIVFVSSLPTVQQPGILYVTPV